LNNYIIIEVIFFLFAVSTNFALSRLSKNAPPFLTFFASGSIFFLALIITQAQGGADFIDTAASAIVYVFLCQIYIVVILISMNSISANFLILLRKSPLTREEVASKFDEGEMVKSRLNRLCEMSCVTPRRGKYALTKRGRLILRWLTAARKFFGHRT